MTRSNSELRRDIATEIRIIKEQGERGFDYSENCLNVIMSLVDEYVDKQVIEARIDEVTITRKRFHQKRFGISEYMNDRLATLKDNLKGGSDATK